MNGLHHVTALCGDAQRNYDFYVGVLGLRLVKATVNYDNPEGWHLYYGDAAGSPGSLITFFPGYGPGSTGLGQLGGTAFSVPPGSLGWWQERFESRGIASFGPEESFEESVLHFVDPDDMPLELVESAAGEGTDIQGLHSVKMFSRDPYRSFEFMREVFSSREIDTQPDQIRLSVGSGGVGWVVDIIAKHGAAPGRPGAGTYHHVAFRVPDAQVLQEMAARVAGLGMHATEIKDRTYFQSVYFREPGGILFELATDGPGFGVNEEALGTSLCLPAHLEPQRGELSAGLPPLHLVTGAILP